MPTARLDVSAEALHDLIPMIAGICRIVGSDTNAHAGTVRLVVEGGAIPEDTALVRCEIERREDGNSVSLNATFHKIA